MQDLISRNSSRLELSMRVTDTIVLILAGQAVSALHFHTVLAEAAPIHAVLLYFCSGIAFLLFPQLGIYTSWRGRSMSDMCLRLAGGWGLVLLMGVFASFLMHHVGHLSRLWVFYWYLAGVLLLVLCRTFVYFVLQHLRKNGINSKRVVIIGYGAIGQEMHRRAAQQDWFVYEVKAVHADPHDLQNLRNQRIHRLATIAAVPQFVATNAIDEVWITLPLTAVKELRELQYLLRNALVDIRWMPDTLSMQMLSNRIIEFLGFPAVDLNQPSAAGPGGLLKEMFDKLFALLVLIGLAPLFAGIAIGIKSTSAGPILFRQPRLGLNGKKFNVYKFRSMSLHEERDCLRQATRNDGRITPFGRFLRRTSLDELPQFINVLIGDMSVVGPRPHALQHNEQYKEVLEQYMLRHRVKPGITGWAQIHGYRGETDTVAKMAMRVQFDLHYIRHWSLWMDLRIILWTAFRGWTGKNAY
jgi:putative colanic acid biosynthesis UDP-glucose lipid carrier transferase